MKFLKNKEISEDPRGQKNVYGIDCRYVNFGHLNPSSLNFAMILTKDDFRKKGHIPYNKVYSENLIFTSQSYVCWQFLVCYVNLIPKSKDFDS